MSEPERRISKGELILVTGANGYIASHVVDILLEEGYKVRGTVRSNKPWLQKYFDQNYGVGKFEIAVLASLKDLASFENALKGVSGVIHIASDVSGNTDPSNVVPQVVAGTKTMLEAAAKEPSIKSVVLTSSASTTVLPKVNQKGIVDENTWNDWVVDAAWKGEGNQYERPKIVYAASKTEGEREFWNWVKVKRPNFAVNSVLPYLNIGEILMPEIAGNTMRLFLKLLEGDPLALMIFPPEWFVNVRDTARVHVAALLDPNVRSERLFACAAPFNWTDVLSILRRLKPEAPLPDSPENEGRDLFDFSKVSGRAERLIQSFFGVPGWASLESTLLDGIGA